MTPSDGQPAPAGGSGPRTVLVVGAGLIGASIGMAMSSQGADVRLEDADAATAQRAADLGAGSTAPLGEPADVAVLAVPPAAVAPALRLLQERGAARTYTDVASVKAAPQAAVAEGALDSASFVGGHPLAGRERSGPGAARADLFSGRPWVLTPRAVNAPEHVERVRALAQACGAVPVVMTADDHDEAVALVSHAPQVVASLLAGRLVDAPEQAIALAGQGLRDTTRIAASDPRLWTAILSSNAAHVAAVLHAVRQDLDEVLAALDALAGGGAAPTAAVTSAVARGNAGRARLPGKHGTAPTTYAIVPVVVPDRPGELARIFVAAGEAGVNIEDVAIEHSPGRPVGLVELAVRPAAADVLAAALARAGWTVHR